MTTTFQTPYLSVECKAGGPDYSLTGATIYTGPGEKTWAIWSSPETGDITEFREKAGIPDDTPVSQLKEIPGYYEAVQ